MQFRTLTDFRAEYGIRLSELAEKLEIPYDELEQIENSGSVPADIAEKIIEYYSLGNMYFTENIGAPPKMPKIKTTPKNPFTYFCKVCIVYSIIVSLLEGLPSSIMMSIGSFVSSQTYDLIMSIVLRIWLAVVSIFSCVLLSKYILKHTTFTGNINKYKYIAFILPTALLKPLNIISNFASSRLLDQYTDEFGTHPDINQIWLLTDAVILILILIFDILLYALINNAAIETDSARQNKTMNIICICTVISQIIYVALAFATKQFSSILPVAIYPCIYALIAMGILLKNKISPKLDTVWYTALPIVTFALPVVFSVINAIN